MARLAFALLILGVFQSPSLFAVDVVLKEWRVPWDNTRPRDPGTGPHNLIVGDNGTIWYAGNQARHIGKLDPDTGTIHKIMMPDSKARDPHTLTFDDAGNIWFTVQGGNFVGKLGVTSDGHVWFVDYARGTLGGFEPDNGTFSEWTMPSGTESRPYGMAVDNRDRIWFVETGVQPNQFVGFDPADENFLSAQPLESGGGQYDTWSMIPRKMKSGLEPTRIRLAEHVFPIPA